MPFSSKQVTQTWPSARRSSLQRESGAGGGPGIIGLLQPRRMTLPLGSVQIEQTVPSGNFFSSHITGSVVGGMTG